jgi:hypothetical protein
VVSAPRVVEDGLETPERKTDRPVWPWLLAGIGIGIGVSVLLFRVESGLVPTESTVAEPSTDNPELGIAGLIEGFPDGLITTFRGDGRSLQLLTWPLRGAFYEETIPVGASNPPDPVVFDESGLDMATLLPVPESPFGVLYAGVPESAAILDLEVTGYAWHDSEALALAYTTAEDGELLLWVTRGNLAESELVARSVGIEGRVVAWGDWGYAVQDEARDSVVLFTESGEIKDTQPGRVLDSDAAGWLAIDNDGVSLLSAGGGVKGIDRPGLGGEILAGSFSTDGEFLALLTVDGIIVVSLDDDSELVASGSRPGVAQLKWTSDARFVMYPGLRGIVVMDTVDWAVDVILETRTFTGIGTLPASQP